MNDVRDLETYTEVMSRAQARLDVALQRARIASTRSLSDYEEANREVALAEGAMNSIREMGRIRFGANS